MENTKQRKHYLLKTAAVIILILSIIAASCAISYFINKRRIPVSTTVKNGLSAYELAVENGYNGTVQEWLNSLSGKSAYQIAKDNGYNGSESEWINSLNAKANKEIASIKSAAFSY